MGEVGEEVYILYILTMFPNKHFFIGKREKKTAGEETL